MVNDNAQLYTIEGVSAAIIMLVTAYVMLNTTTLYTPADNHVTDMQLEQIGNDALAIMDTADVVNPIPPTNYGKKESDLESFIMQSNTSGFNTTFMTYINALYSGVDSRPLSYNATVYYNTPSGVKSYPFYHSKNMTGKEHYVSVTRWVHLSGKPSFSAIVSDPGDMEITDQVVLLEVILWRD